MAQDQKSALRVTTNRQTVNGVKNTSVRRPGAKANKTSSLIKAGKRNVKINPVAIVTSSICSPRHLLREKRAIILRNTYLPTPAKIAYPVSP